MCLRAVIAFLRERSLVCLLFQFELNDGGWWISIESAVVVICEQFFTCLINERRVIVQEIIKKKRKTTVNWSDLILTLLEENNV